MKIHVAVPATTANLGPGFDALGLALNLWNEANFTLRDDGKIVLTVQGEGTGAVPLDENNLVAEAALQVFELAGQSCPGLQIDCTNRVPLGSGMGSSSAGHADRVPGGQRPVRHPLHQRGNSQAGNRKPKATPTMWPRPCWAG